MPDRKLYKLLVAKYSTDNQWLSYYNHLRDTAGVMDKLFNHWLPLHIVDALSERNPSAEWDRLCRFIALTHDIGKATPVFQAMICEHSGYLREKMIAEGLDVQELSVFLDRSRTPHAQAGEAILLSRGCPAGVAAVVGTHHGAPGSGAEDPSDRILIYEQNFYGSKGRNSAQGQKWDQVWDQWISYALECSGYADIGEIPEIDVPAQMVISGMLMMADWIASNPEYAPLISLDENTIEFDYPDRVNEIWERVSFPDQWMPSSYFMDDEEFKERFGFEPNQMQRQILDIVADASAPGIYILEAQMGTGKTEAALAASEVLASRWHCEGVYFGLPTQATANSIFHRVKAWLIKQMDGGQLSLRLAHGNAAMQKDYKEIFHGYACQNEDVDKKDGLIVHSWFDGRKKTLLSSFVVGTVDQLLMSALQQKHVMLRHLGIAGKVVVVDECHAYDAYMSCYLERVLEWLGIYQIPVILLSATLPSKRRAKLVEAYCGKNILLEDMSWYGNEDYPVLTYTDGNIVKQVVMESENGNKQIHIVRAKEDDIVGILKRKLAEGGSAGVIVNTVDKAQKIAREIRNQMPDYTVLLLHARYTIADRQQLEEKILERLGKSSVADIRNLVVVGTQILEQSLDIDFDLMISQIAPIDLILQRLGRLHRHAARQRPKPLRNAEFILLEYDEADKASAEIYSEWLLRRTEELLAENISLPEDISPLIQEAYRDLEESEEFYPLWKAQMDKQRIKERKAQSHRIPAEEDMEETLHGLLDASIGDRESDALARVRDGESSLSVLLMVAAGTGYVKFLPWRSQGECMPMDHVPSEDECSRILLQKVQLPRTLSVYSYQGCISELEQRNIAYLEEWQQSRMLGGELILLLKEDLTANLCGYRLSYDQNYGLICTKEGMT